MNTLGFYEGIPIFIATKEYQRRKHHKKRINKKWRKRYGVIEYNSIPHGQIVYNEFNRVMYMTKKTFEEIQALFSDGQVISVDSGVIEYATTQTNIMAMATYIKSESEEN